MKLAVAYSNEEVETLGVQKSQNFGFSKDAEEMIFTMFTKNIYSNPIGSVVREITSNCFDSHKEANVTDPVILKLTKENSENYISFIDVGVGMSPERVTKVYAQYFNSTKRDDNNQIGGFGIGGKTPLAYAESFFLITVFDRVKYTYSIRKGKSSPVLDLLTKAKTIERNGTTIKIPVRYNDVSVFEREMVRQLYYFENVIFEGFSANLKNDYRIIEGKNFMYRGKDYMYATHICLGRVAYPIDFSVLEDVSGNDDTFASHNWDVPVAIKMEIGDINVTVSREAIDYTESTKKLIKKKLLAVKAEMLEMLDKQHEKLNTLEEFYRLEDNSSTLFVSKTDSVDLRSFTGGRYQLKFHKMDALNIPSQMHVIHLFYGSSMFGKKGRREHTWDKSLRRVGDEHVYFVKEGEEMPRKKNGYMKFMFKHYYSLYRRDLPLSEIKKMIKDLTLTNSTASTRTVFKQFRELQQQVYALVESKVKKYSSIVVPTGFTISKAKSYDPNSEMPVTFNSKYGFDKEKIKMESLEKSKATLYYGDLDTRNEMEVACANYIALFAPKDSVKFRIHTADYMGYPVRFIMVSRTNLKYVAELRNAKPISEFNKVLLRKRDAVIKHVQKRKFISEFEKQHNLFLNYNLFSRIDKTYARTIKQIQTLKQKYDALPNYVINVNEGSQILQVLSIDPKSITSKGAELFKVVEETTKKNGMLNYVNVSSNFNPNSSYVDQKESDNILKLLSLAYVQ